MTLKYHLFLSCEDILVENQKIESLLNKIIESDQQTGDSGRKIVKRLCRKDYEIKELKDKFDRFNKSSLYVVNTHEKLDNINYWEIGYAMGKGIEVIGYSDGESEKKIPENIEDLINVPRSVTNFIEHIMSVIDDLEPKKDIFSQEWLKQLSAAKKEFKEGF